MTVPKPVRLTPMAGNYRSFACPEKDCYWHAHGETDEAADEKYQKHYADVHYDGRETDAGGMENHHV